MPTTSAGGAAVLRGTGEIALQDVPVTILTEADWARLDAEFHVPEVLPWHQPKRWERERPLPDPTEAAQWIDPAVAKLLIPYASIKETAKAYYAGEISFKEYEIFARDLGLVAPLPPAPPPRRPPRPPRSPRQRSPDKERSVRRRKTLAQTKPLPPKFGCQLTFCELAYARLLADDFAKKGFTDDCHANMAARIGCCIETVVRSQNTLRSLGLIAVQHRPVPGRKSLPNLIKIIDTLWISWLNGIPNRQADPWKPGRVPPADTNIGGHFCQATVKEIHNSRRDLWITAAIPLLSDVIRQNK
jgi:hypothetical protein